MNKRIIYFFFLLVSGGLLAQSGVSHDTYDQLLQKYVDEQGMVNYKGLSSERSRLRSYLTMLESNPPQKTWTRDQRLAYWINAYNAFTLELILEHYPIESIRELGSTIKIPFVSTAWDIKFINIGEKEYDLNNLEHGIIRKEFDEPRIHFALVCAAVSCPKLQNRAYVPEKLDAQLTSAAKQFLSNPSKNLFENKKRARLSKIFSWYGGDFKKKESLIDYLNRYAPIQLDGDAKIDFQDYDWGLNEQQ